MEKCKICNKISYNLNNGFCKKCSKVNQGNIDICTQCNKITAYNIDDLCIECSKGTMTTEAIISKLEIKDPAKLSTLLRIGEKTIIQIAEQLKIENFRKYKCHKCSKYIENLGLCEECSNLRKTLSNMNHLKTLRKISDKGDGTLHVKTK